MSVEVPELAPNVQEKVVPVIGTVVFVKLTSSGGQPEVVEAVKPAVSAEALLHANINIKSMSFLKWSTLGILRCISGMTMTSPPRGC